MEERIEDGDAPIASREEEVGFYYLSAKRIAEKDRTHFIL